MHEIEINHIRSPPNNEHLLQAKLTKMYAHLPEESPSFPEALLAQTKRMRTPGRLMMRLRKPVAEHSWMTAPETINAFYTAVMNEIIIPLGILQPPFYKSGRPEVRIRGLTWCLYWQTLVLVLGLEVTLFSPVTITTTKTTLAGIYHVVGSSQPQHFLQIC